jgi:predicted DNA-binding transcriptional regulator YafY
MAKKSKALVTASTSPVSVTSERFVRLYRMVKLLAGSPQSREALTKRLRLDVRGFYRDLDLLRSSGVTVALVGGQYLLEQDAEEALDLLPFPDPRLTLGAARTLAKGRGPAQRRLAEAIARIVPSR